MATRYDLILVYTSFRRHNDYINIISSLATSYKVGIWLCAWDRSGKNETEYLAHCETLGAHMVTETASCQVLILPRIGGGVIDEVLEVLPHAVTAEKVFLLIGGVFNGFLFFDQIKKKFGKVSVLAAQRDLLGLAEPELIEKIKEEKLEVIEVGYPYKKHPIFPNFETDYLLAFPSHTTVPDDFVHFRLIEKIAWTLLKLPRQKQVSIKLHNVRDDGNRVSKTILLPFWLRRTLAYGVGVPLVYSIRLLNLTIKSRDWIQIVPRKIIRIMTTLMLFFIFDRGDNLLKNYPGYGIEHFIHGVSQAIITGISNSVVLARSEGKDLIFVGEKPQSKTGTHALIYQYFIDPDTRVDMGSFGGSQPKCWANDCSGTVVEYLDSVLR